LEHLTTQDGFTLRIWQVPCLLISASSGLNSHWIAAFVACIKKQLSIRLVITTASYLGDLRHALVFGGRLVLGGYALIWRSLINNIGLNKIECINYIKDT